MAVCWVVFIIMYVDVSCQPTTASPVLPRLAGDNATNLNEIINNPIRLAGNNSLPNAGRLEVYFHNTWGTVCDDYFSNKEAQVSCYMLGFGRSGLSMRNYYGSGSGPIWLDDTQCSGEELSLAECRHTGWGVHDCDHSEDVSIICDNNCSATHPECTAVWNTSIEDFYGGLLNGTVKRDQLSSTCNCSVHAEHDGCTFYYLSTQVQLYVTQTSTTDQIQQQYGKVSEFLHHLCRNIQPDYELYQSCYSTDIYVALRRMCRYNDGDDADYYYTNCDWLQSRKYCYARVIQEICNTSAADINMLRTVIYGLRVSRFDQTLYVLDFSQLIGNATDLSEIINKMPRLTVRLAGDNRSANAGRLEIYYNNTWGTVCDDRFDNRDAQVACYMLGFGRSGLSLGNYYGGGSGPIWIDNVDCSGEEVSLAECGHRGWGAHYCKRHEDVSIICDNNNCSANHPTCVTVWNTDVIRLSTKSLSRNQLLLYCSDWNKCNVKLQESGCTFADIFVQVLQYPQWSQLNDYTPMQHRYNQALASLRDMCNFASKQSPIDREGVWYETTLSGTRSATSAVPHTIMSLVALSIDSVRPLYGPVAGGTRVTITGQFLSVSAVTAVYFGQHQGIIDKQNLEENTVFAITPPVNANARLLTIELVLYDGSRISTNWTFEYRHHFKEQWHERTSEFMITDSPSTVTAAAAKSTDDQLSTTTLVIILLAVLLLVLFVIFFVVFFLQRRAISKRVNEGASSSAVIEIYDEIVLDDIYDQTNEYERQPHAFTDDNQPDHYDTIPALQELPDYDILWHLDVTENEQSSYEGLEASDLTDFQRRSQLPVEYAGLKPNEYGNTRDGAVLLNYDNHRLNNSKVGRDDNLDADGCQHNSYEGLDADDLAEFRRRSQLPVEYIELELHDYKNTNDGHDSVEDTESAPTSHC